MRRRIGLTALIAVVALLIVAAPSSAAPAYPDLKTRTPFDLRFDQEYLDGSWHWLLRFSNTVWNAGSGRLELSGQTISENGTTKSRVYQHVYDGSNYTPYHVGDFVWHAAHNHFHFESFAEYELWTKSEYDNWIASGRNVGQAQRRGTKTTFCVMDTDLITGTAPALYTSCGQTLQGLQVGWGDTYGYHLADQWIDLGASKLAAGYYVLRSVADPRNRLYESASKAGDQESTVNNEATRCFRVRSGRIRSC